MDFGAWWSYADPRLAGYELREEQAKKGRAAWTFGSKERKEFAEFYAAEASAAATASQGGTSTARLYGLTCTGPVKYVGHDAIKRDIENLAAVRATRVEEAFTTAASASDAPNPAERLLQKCRGLYLRLGRGDRRGIQGHRRCRLHPADRRSGAGRHLRLVVLDERRHCWLPQMGDVPSRGCQPRASRHPGGSIRFHICWGSWHGPHKGDVPLKEVVDLLLKVRAQGYSVEAGNVRHEHE